MKVILPVAGKGTRLRPHTHSKAKSLVQVAGKTVLEHILERLQPLAVSEYLFIVDDQGEQIQQFVARQLPQLPCRFIVQQQRCGPAHAVGLAAARIAAGDDLLIVFNDTIFETDLRAIPQLCADADGLIYSLEVEDYQRFGVNVLRDGYIVDMVEKPDTPVSRLAQVGLFYLKDGARFMAALAESIAADERVKGEFYLPPVFMRLIRQGARFRAPLIDAWLDCGTPQALLQTNARLLQCNQAMAGEAHNCLLLPPVHVAAGAVLRDSIIGPNVSVAAGAVVERSILRDCILNRDVRLFNQVLADSLLGEEVQLVGAARKMNIGDHSLVIIQE